MRSSVVNIESVSNNSFGTGFVIDSDERGVYILTCAHVLDDVKTPVVENVLAKVIAKGSFIDMAVLYVSKLQLAALPLQTAESDNLDVEVIGFSSFNQNLTQKKHINATLYKELIELHSKQNDLFYTVRKIKANDGFNFDRGNSGSPVISKESGNVIAMISNKEGSDIGYAINIANIKEVWKEIPSHLFKAKDIKTEPKEKIEPVSGRKEEPPIIIPQTKNSNFSIGKYILSTTLLLMLGLGTYSFIKPTSPRPPYSQVNPPKKELKVKDEKAHQITINKEEVRKKEKVRLEKAYFYEKQGFKSLLSRNYADALRNFKKANSYKSSLHHVPQIISLLEQNKMRNIVKRRKVLSTILQNYSKYAPKGFSQNLKKQLRQTFINPQILDLGKVTIKRPPRQLDLENPHLRQPREHTRPKH